MTAMETSWDAFSASAILFFLLAVRSVPARVCTLGTEPDASTGGRVQFVLPPGDPCFCTQIKLGGHNTYAPPREDAPVYIDYRPTDVAGLGRLFGCMDKKSAEAVENSQAGSNAPCATYKKEPGATTTIYDNNFPERIHLSVLTTEIVRVTAHKQGGYQYVEFQPSPRESRVYGSHDYNNRTKIHAGIKLDGSRYWIAFNYSKISVGKYGTEDPLMVYTDPNAGSYGKITVWNQLKTVWQLYEKC